jgi:tetratricopeptide (TPR) repeat protein
LLALLVREQGRYDEALRLTEEAEAASSEDDFDSQALWRTVRAPILARSGDIRLAEEIARRAVELAGESEAPVMHADALTSLAAVQASGGSRNEAIATYAAAIALYDSKGNIVAAARCRSLAAALRH